jgi:hypothetical protein
MRDENEGPVRQAVFFAYKPAVPNLLWKKNTVPRLISRADKLSRTEGRFLHVAKRGNSSLLRIGQGARDWRWKHLSIQAGRPVWHLVKWDHGSWIWLDYSMLGLGKGLSFAVAGYWIVTDMPWSLEEFFQINGKEFRGMVSQGQIK